MYQDGKEDCSYSKFDRDHYEWEVLPTTPPLTDCQCKKEIKQLQQIVLKLCTRLNITQEELNRWGTIHVK